MKDVDLIALAGLLHDIGKFGQRAEIPLRDSQFSKSKYNYLHAAYSAQIMTDLFKIDDTTIDHSAMHHNLKVTSGDDEYWIVASADRLASGFERETFEAYNNNAVNENFKKQRLVHLFDENKTYMINSLSIDTIFAAKEKGDANEYKQLWENFIYDLEKIEIGNRHTDLNTIDYLLKKYTSFIPSSTTFSKGDFAPVKANIPLYDHLKTTALFAGAISAMDEDNKQNVLNFYKK